MHRHPEISPPWAATACVLLALVSLALNESATARGTSGQTLPGLNELGPIAASAFAMLLSRFWLVRLERGHAAVWTLRGLVYSAAVIYTIVTSERIQSFYYLNFISRLSGLIFVLESALQHWQRPPA